MDLSSLLPQCLFESLFFLYFVAVVVVWVGPVVFGSVIWVGSLASLEIGKATVATVTMRRLVVFLLGSDSTATMGQALLFGPVL